MQQIVLQYKEIGGNTARMYTWKWTEMLLRKSF